MAYPLQQEVGEVAVEVKRLVGYFTDEVSDETQAAQILAQFTLLGTSLKDAMGKLDSKVKKLEFFIRVAGAILTRLAPTVSE